MFEKVHYVSVNKRNGHQLLIHMSILYVKDVVTLLNPGSWRGECSWESGESAVEAECDTQTIEVEDEIQVATMPSSTMCTIHRSEYTQTTAFKPTRSVKTQTLIDATSSFFCEMKQSLPTSESTPENSGSIAQTSGIQKVDQNFQYSPSKATSTESEDTRS